MTYSFHKALNLKKVLAYTPPPEIDITGLSLPSDWQKKLIELLSVESTALYEHIGPNSPYKLKLQLLEACQIIYWRLNGDLDKLLGILYEDERASLIEQAVQDILNCTHGFHNRINFIVNNLNQPRNLDELLFKARTALVWSVAAQLSGWVHSSNFVTLIAANNGLGVHHNFKDDDYQGGLQQHQVETQLEKQFLYEFTPFKLPLLLCTQIRSLCVSIGYTGKRTLEKAYEFAVYNTIYTLLKKIIPSLEINTLFIIEDEVFILDIDWFKLEQMIFDLLIHEKYIDENILTVSPQNLFECIKRTDLLKLELTKELDNYKQYENNFDLVNQYGELINYYPSFKTNVDFNTYFLNWINLKVIAQEYDLLLEILKLNPELFFKLLDCINLSFSQFLLKQDKKGFNALMIIVQYQPSTLPKFLGFLAQDQALLNSAVIDSLFLQTNHHNENIFMFAAAQKQSMAFSLLLNFLMEHQQILHVSMFKKPFLQINTDGWDVFLIAAQSSPISLSLLLDFFKKNYLILGKTYIRNILLHKNKFNSNSVMIIAQQYPKTLPIMFNFLIEHLNVQDIASILLQKNHIGWNALMYAAGTGPTAFIILLDWLKYHVDNKLIMEGLLYTNSNNCNVLMVAAKYQPKVVEILVDFLTSNQHHIDYQSILKMLGQADMNGWNALMKAIFHQPLSLHKILDLLIEYQSYWNTQILIKILLQTESNGWNILMIAAGYQPTALEVLLNFLISQKSFLNSKSIAKMIFQTDTQGKKNACIMVFDIQPKLFIKLFDSLIIEKDSLIIRMIQQYFLQHDSALLKKLIEFVHLETAMLPSLLNILLLLPSDEIKHLDVLGSQEQIMNFLDDFPLLAFNYFFYNNNYENFDSEFIRNKLSILMQGYEEDIEQRKKNKTGLWRGINNLFTHSLAAEQKGLSRLQDALKQGSSIDTSDCLVLQQGKLFIFMEYLGLMNSPKIL